MLAGLAAAFGLLQGNTLQEAEPSVSIRANTLLEAEPEVFIKGLEDSPVQVYSVSYNGEFGLTADFDTGAESFTAIALWHDESVWITTQQSNTKQREVLFRDGRPTMATKAPETYPQIGFQGGAESKANRYLMAVHDFTGDGIAEFLLGVRSVNGIAVYVFRRQNGRWAPLGEMVSDGKGLGGCRVFRQAITLKDEATGTLFTWTCHGNGFDFLASDHDDDPSRLY